MAGSYRFVMRTPDSKLCRRVQVKERVVCHIRLEPGDSRAYLRRGRPQTGLNSADSLFFPGDGWSSGPGSLHIRQQDYVRTPST